MPETLGFERRVSSPGFNTSILEEKNVKEPSEQNVAANEIKNYPALLRQFFCVADKDAFAHG